MNLKDKMRVVDGFPKEGISYKDITTILQDADSLKEMTRVLTEALNDVDFDYILGIDARGFIVGVAVALEMDKGFLMARKPGKLPGNIVQESYSLEYGEATIELDVDSVPDGSRIVIMDDLLATGGTALAACNLVEKAGGKVAALEFLTELTDLEGREKLEAAGHRVISVLKWDH